ncbi:hypothetical protein TARUN_5041 [Trichoderma arundinaceum]|uniref:Uncharacterized protein n=1 Tax=Trichoderma arundinaceum TaxID=490622 RepID=A0A395NM99_TRIAR|nr:hypothetical protein TARUN_5041 [Trichoderma arundinaceum]
MSARDESSQFEDSEGTATPKPITATPKTRRDIFNENQVRLIELSKCISDLSKSLTVDRLDEGRAELLRLAIHTASIAQYNEWQMLLIDTYIANHMDGGLITYDNWPEALPPPPHLRPLRDQTEGKPLLPSYHLKALSIRNGTQ